MPELPDITVYIEALDRRIVGRPLEDIRLKNPFLLRTALPPVRDGVGRKVRELRRIGKRIAVGLDNDLWLVLHLMIAGRMHWKQRGAEPAGRNGLAAFDFPDGTLILTEAGTKRRAALHVTQGEDGLAAFDPGGLEVFDIDAATFAATLQAHNHTLKRALTDPHIFAGIGNAYSDEVLHAARLSPVAMSRSLTAEEIERLFAATREVLALWVDRLRAETGDGFPEKVTAFRPDMAVHGKYGEPCPVCDTAVQRIRHASNETNYCPRCQTNGKLLADRALSRLLKKDWPRSVDELERLRPQTQS